MAEMSDFHRAPVGCVAVIGNKVVATGFSQQRTHPMQRYYNRFRDFNGQTNITAKLHAECAMLSSFRHLNIEFSKADVYIYRICRSRDAGLAKPCLSCEMALRSAGIKNVYYTSDDGFCHDKII
jgi:deoxycytidylate deaminase